LLATMLRRHQRDESARHKWLNEWLNLAQALEAFGPATAPVVPDLAEALTELLSHKCDYEVSDYYYGVCGVLCEKLAQIGPAAAGAAHQLSLALRNENLCRTAALALSQIGEAGIQELNLALRHKDRNVRIAAAHHLLMYTDQNVESDAIQTDA